MLSNDAKETSIDQLCASTLEHYERVSTIAHEWNNQVPQAIKAWYEQKKRSLSEPAAPEGETPRTDALKRSVLDRRPLPLWPEEMELVYALAGTLERELAQMAKRVSELEARIAEPVAVVESLTMARMLVINGAPIGTKLYAIAAERKESGNG